MASLNCGCEESSSNFGRAHFRLPTFAQDDTMHSSPLSFRAYKAVIALNNMGVTLLQRGSYHDAVNTFRDAVETMKSFYPGAIEPAMNSSQSEQVIDACLHRAQRCCAATSNRPTVPITLFEAFSEETHATRTIAQKVIIKSLVSPKCSPIRLQEVICEDCTCCTSSDAHLDAAILLYNFGVSYMCCSSSAFSSSPSHEMNEHISTFERWSRGAWDLLELSLHMLSTHSAATQAIYVPFDYERKQVLLAISHAVIGALSFLEDQLGGDENDNYYRARHERLSCSILALLNEHNRDVEERTAPCVPSGREGSSFNKCNNGPVMDYHAAPAA